ncbi:MAG: glycosyltransferase family 4 protein [Sulfolobales archaeon]
MKIGIFSGTPLEVYGGTEVWSLEVGNRLVRKGYDVYFIAPKNPITKDVERTKVYPEFKYYRVPYRVLKLGPLKAYMPEFYPRVDVKYLANIGVFPIADDKTILGGHTMVKGVEFYNVKRILTTLIAKSGKVKVAHALTRGQAIDFINMGFSKVYVIPNGVDCNKYKVGEVEKPRVVFIGRLTPQKGIHILVSIAAKAKDIEFIIIGEGPLKDLVIRASKRLKNLIYMGFVDENTKVEILSKSSIFILPSLYEIMPLSILEAAVSGLVVIASDLPYIRELEIYKILCRTTQCFIENIYKYIFKVNLTLKQEIRRKALKYCWESIITKIEHMITEVYEKV